VDLGVVLQLENRTKLRGAHGLEESSVGFGAFGVLSLMAPKQDSVQGMHYALGLLLPLSINPDGVLQPVGVCISLSRIHHILGGH
jgi:hypothetical protein